MVLLVIIHFLNTQDKGSDFGNVIYNFKSFFIDLEQNRQNKKVKTCIINKKMLEVFINIFGYSVAQQKYNI